MPGKHTPSTRTLNPDLHPAGSLGGVITAVTMRAARGSCSRLPGNRRKLRLALDLSRGQVPLRGDIQPRIGIKKAHRLQKETCRLHRHHWPIFHARYVRHAKGVPDDAVRIGDVAILRA